MSAPRGGIPKLFMQTEEERFEGVNDPLARLVRVVMYERNIQIPDYVRAIERYYDLQHPNMTRAARNSDKSNLKDALDHTPLSFKNFLKIMNILAMTEDGLVDIDFSVAFKNKDDPEASSKHDVRISSVNAKRRKSIKRNT